MSIERRIAAGDLGLFLALAVPGLGPWLVESLLGLNRLLELPGHADLAGLSPLLLGLMGLLGAGFAWARLNAAPGVLRKPAMLVKGAAVLLFVLAVLGGAPAVLLLLAAADAVAALLLAVARDPR